MAERAEVALRQVGTASTLLKWHWERQLQGLWFPGELHHFITSVKLSGLMPLLLILILPIGLTLHDCELLQF